mmetsp:Transcript_26133/g.56679  ORF Transcript_26133/g.56679 Transcript_26133/m.56679 type:complete len:1722 (-) Transcript_26133:12-5177(-)
MKSADAAGDQELRDAPQGSDIISANSRNEEGTAKATRLPWFPELLDFVEDAVRLRALGVFVMTGMYIIVALAVVGIPDGNVNLPSSLEFTSFPPSRLITGLNVSTVRAPVLRLVDESSQVYSEVNGVPVSFSVEVVAFFPSTTVDTLDCGTDLLQSPSMQGTLEEVRTRAACAAELENDLAQPEGELSVAKFSELTVVRSPSISGMMEVAFSTELEKEKFTSETLRIKVATDVFGVDLSIGVEAPAQVRAHQKFKFDMNVTNREGLPLEGVICTAISWTEADFWAPFRLLDFEPPSPGSFTDPFTPKEEVVPIQRVFAMGQRYAKLSGDVSAPSDASGRVTFPALAVEASTSPEVYIMFSCDGVMQSLTVPELAPGEVRFGPQMPLYRPPLIIRTTVARVEVAGATSSSTVTVDEGSPVTPAVTVRLLDASGRPVAGVVVVAVLAAQSGTRFPGRYIRQKGSAPPVKHLTGFISNASDANGLAEFPKLAFQVPGLAAGESLLSFCAERVCSDPASSPRFVVRSTVAEVRILRQPTYLHLNGTDRSDPAGVPREFRNGRGADLPVVQLLDVNEQGVPGKVPRVLLIDLDANEGYRGGTEAPVELRPDLAKVAVDYSETTLSGSDGFVEVAVSFVYLTPAAKSSGRVALVFEVDGRHSAPSAAVQTPLDTAKLFQGRCAALKTVEAPPSSATVRRAFDQPVELQAVDSVGTPIEENELLVVAVSKEQYPRAPTLFTLGASGLPDFAPVGREGSVLMRHAAFERPYGTNTITFGHRGDVFETGVSGTAVVQYVALRVDPVKLTQAYAILNTQAGTFLNRTEIKAWTRPLMAQYLRAATMFECRALVGGNATSDDEEDNEDSKKHCNLLDLCISKRGKHATPLLENISCSIECVSEEFMVEVESPVASIAIETSESDSDSDTGLEMTVTAEGYRISTPFTPYALTRKYSALNITIRDANGSAVQGANVDIEFEQVPSSLGLGWKTGLVTCPSVQTPLCYLQLNNETQTIEPVYEAVPEEPDDLFVGSFPFTKYSFIGCLQSPGGSDENGNLLVQCVVYAGAPGQYTMSLGNGFVKSLPITYFVPNAVAKIEVVAEEAEKPEEYSWQTVEEDGTTFYLSGNPIPGPVLKLVDSEGKPVRGYQVTAWLVDDGGFDAPVLLDATPKKHSPVIGNVIRFSSISGPDGIVRYSTNSGQNQIIPLDAMKGCYRYQFGIFPCGEGGNALSNTCSISDFKDSYPVISSVLERRVCVMSAWQLSISQEPSDTVGMQQRFQQPPGFVMQTTAPSLLNKIGMGMLVVVPARITDPLEETGLFGGRANRALLKAIRKTTRQDGEDIPPENRFDEAKALRRNACIWFERKVIFGRCGSVVTSVVGDAESEAVYRTTITFDNLQFNTGLDQQEFSLAAAAGSVIIPELVMTPEDKEQQFSPRTLSVEVSSVAANVIFVTEPPQNVEVGKLFLMRVRVSIKSGGPLPFATVTAALTSGGAGLIETAADFLDRRFGAQNVSVASNGAFPALDRARVVAKTDRNGIAVFKLRVTEGMKGSYAAYVKVGSVRSKKSRSFRLLNPVQSVAHLFEQRTFKVKKTDLPALLDLGNFTVRVKNNSNQPISDLVEPSMFKFNIFLKQDYEAQQAANAAGRLLNNSASALERARDVWTLIVQGSNRLRPNQAAKNTNLTFAGVPVDNKDGTYTLRDAKLSLRRYGEYRIQVIVLGQASLVSTNESSYDI